MSSCRRPTALASVVTRTHSSSSFPPSLPPSLDVVKTRLQTDPERYQGLGIWGACEKIR